MPATLNDIQRKYGESVYPLYKDQMHEPYTENDNGAGYAGVVLYDELEDKVQCSECGKWFKWITLTHLKSHKINSHAEYKQKYGLNKRTALCSKEMSKKHSVNARTNPNIKKQQEIAKKLPKEHFEKMSKIGHISRSSFGQMTMQSYNKINLCDAQIASRWAIILEQLGHPPTEKDLNRLDMQLYKGIKSRYGNLTNASKALGIIINTKSDGSKKRWGFYYTDIKLISVLRNWVVNNKKIPSSCGDLGRKGLPAFETFQKYFGSWRRAKMMAGLDQLLAEVKST